MKFFEKFEIFKFSKNFDFGQIFEKLWFLWKFSILIKIWKNFDFRKFRRISILVENDFGQFFKKNFDFSEIFEKISISGNFSQIFFDFVHPILLKISKNLIFFENFEKISILVVSFEIFHFSQNFRKNFDFGQIF